MRVALFLSYIAVAITSCAVAPTKEVSPNELPVLFVCTNGEEIEVRFFPDRQRAVLNRGSRIIELPQQLSGSGFIYGNGHDTIRGKGKELTVIMDGTVPLYCTAR